MKYYQQNASSLCIPHLLIIFSLAKQKYKYYSKFDIYHSHTCTHVYSCTYVDSQSVPYVILYMLLTFDIIMRMFVSTWVCIFHLTLLSEICRLFCFFKVLWHRFLFSLTTTSCTHFPAHFPPHLASKRLYAPEIYAYLFKNLLHICSSLTGNRMTLKSEFIPSV